MSFLDTIRSYAIGSNPQTTIPQGGGVNATPRVAQGGGEAGLVERLGAIGGNSYGNFNHDAGLQDRLAAIDNQQLRPKAFLGKTTDFYC